MQFHIVDTEFIGECLKTSVDAGMHSDCHLFIQASIKFTAEPPQGVKAGLKRTYGIITQEQLDISNMPQWKPLLYVVAFLHTTVQVCKLINIAVKIT